MSSSINLHQLRQPEASVENVFVERWSPRAFEPNFEISESDLRVILEAARWAPSSFNEQPWRIHVAQRNSPAFKGFKDCLVEANQVWAKDSSVLGFILGKKNFSKTAQENLTFQFDCGSAWMSLTLQARMLDLYTHGMGGIDREKVIKTLKANPEEEIVVAGFALGKIASADRLPEDLKELESPSPRKPQSEIFKIHRDAED